MYSQSDLLGYLLNAIDPHEREKIAEALAHDETLQEELAKLKSFLAPLEDSQSHFEPRGGLAESTCQAIFEELDKAPKVRLGASSDEAIQSLTEQREAPSSLWASASSWRFLDSATTLGACLLFCLLFFPAILHSRQMTKRLICQDNLRQIGVAFNQYSSYHGGYYPPVMDSGHSLGFAGSYATVLRSNGFLEHCKVVLCPSGKLGGERDRPSTSASEYGCDEASFRVALCDELDKASRELRAFLQRLAGGDYAYNIGCEEDSRRGFRADSLENCSNYSQNTFPILADTPLFFSDDVAHTPHGKEGQNVLYLDGSVFFLSGCKACRTQDDDIYRNDQGRTARSRLRNDIVLAGSQMQPCGTSLQVDSPYPQGANRR
ncbi:MAG: hypothetical protein MPJ24_02435 [Pirellulaceae bacterium]|nr:hypothetical protein [Pirellulaceae bacterium]